MSIKLMSIVWELDLPSSEKLVLLSLADQANDDGTQCWPSVRRLVARCGQSERTVQRAIKSLQKRGLISVEERKGTSSNYLIHPRQPDTPVKKSPPSNTTKTPVTVTPKPLRTTNRKKNTKRNGCAVAKPDDVTSQTWEDFMDHRKRMKANVTVTALNGIRSQADKAGWSMEAALIELVTQGWRGFKADWVQKAKPANDQNGFLAHKIKQRALQ